jgi:hypothetical protein
VNAYLAKLRALQKSQKETLGAHSKPSKPGFEGFEGDRSAPICNFQDRCGGLPTRTYARVLAALESGPPDLVPVARWQQAVEDSQRFLSRWGDQARALGWTAKDLFGLHNPPEKPDPSYSRLSRYDETGLIWLLQGREVVALTDAAATIKGDSGNITTYRKHQAC